MKTLFLHIGFFKTGTTSIQACLSANSVELLKRGIFYPTGLGASYVYQRKHTPLVEALPDMKPKRLGPDHALMDQRAYHDLFQTLEKTEFDKLILSAEGFSGPKVGHKQMEWFQQSFSGYEIKIIVYIRPQDVYLPSVYQQLVKGDFAKRFDLAMHKSMSSLYFARRIRPWREVFGIQNVIVRPFKPALWREGELFYDFLHALGLSYDGLKLEKAVNEGLDHRAIELLRELNSISSFNHNTRKLRNRMAANIHAFMGKDFKKKKMVLSSEESNILRSHYRSENIEALEGTGISVDDFFPPAPVDQEACLPPDTLSEDLLLRVIYGLALKQR